MPKLQTKGIIGERGPIIEIKFSDSESAYMTPGNAEQFAMQILKVVATVTSQWEIVQQGLKRRKNGSE